MAALQRIDWHVQHGHVVGHEKSVELAALQRLREAFEMREVEIRVGEGAGIAPGASMDGRRSHEGGELELTWFCHWQRLSPLRIQPSEAPDAIGLLRARRDRQCH